MRIALTTLAAIVSLILVVKVVAASSKTAADTKAIKSQTQNEMSIYDLHAGYPNMKNLPAQETPLP